MRPHRVCSALVFCALAGSFTGTARAALVYMFDDLTETVNAYVNSGSGNVLIGGACVGESCFVTVPLNNPAPADLLTVIAFTEGAGGPVSDYLTYQEFNGERTSEIRFFSDPLPTTFPPPLPTPLPVNTFVEDGTYQPGPMVNRGTDQIEIFMRSDVEPVPEPAGLGVLACALLGAYAIRARVRNRQNSQRRHSQPTALDR